MARGIFITGTDTGVGKTVVTAAVTRHLVGRGLSIGVMKPVETGIPDGSHEWTDGFRLRSAAGIEASIECISPYRFVKPLAPLASAREAGMTIEVGTILRSLDETASHHALTLVEGIGGVMVPLAADCDVRDLIEQLGLPVVVVGRSALGGISHARMTIEALQVRGCRTIALVLNEPCSVSSAIEWEQTRTTQSLLRELSDVPVLGPINFASNLSRDWLKTIDELAGHSAIIALADIILSVAGGTPPPPSPHRMPAQ